LVLIYPIFVIRLQGVSGEVMLDSYGDLEPDY